MAPAIGSTYFAAAGDVHGHHRSMVRLISDWEQRTGNRISFVLQAGDFEPHRDEADLATMSAPAKYKQAGDFAAFRSGRERFPWPVYFIGGNHEPYGFLETIPDGGEVAPNCFYMGRVGSAELAGLCVVGVSGIYGEEAFYRARPRPEEIATRSNKEYIYFTEDEIGRALDYTTTDILILHEWPTGVIDPGHMAEFEAQGRSLRYDRIGNDYARMLLDLLAPKLLICGHMHKSYRNRIELPNGEHANICALANIEAGREGVGFFAVENGEVREEGWEGKR